MTTTPSPSIEEQALAYFTQRHEIADRRAAALRISLTKRIKDSGLSRSVGEVSALLRAEAEAEVWRALHVMAEKPEHRLSILSTLNGWLTSPGGKSTTDPFENEAAHIRVQATLRALAESMPYLTDDDVRSALAYLSAAPYGGV